MSPSRSSRARPSVGLTPTITSARERADMRRAAKAAMLMAGACGPAGAQPSSDSAIQPATALENFRHVQISIGLITAQIYPPGANELYRGTRYNQTRNKNHNTNMGQDCSTFWFDRFVTV